MTGNSQHRGNFGESGTEGEAPVMIINNGTSTTRSRAKTLLVIAVLVSTLTLCVGFIVRNGMRRRDPDYTDWKSEEAAFDKPLEDLNATRLTSVEEACDGLSYCVEYKTKVLCNTTLGIRISASSLEAVLVEIDCDTGDETDVTGREDERRRLPSAWGSPWHIRSYIPDKAPQVQVTEHGGGSLRSSVECNGVTRSNWKYSAPLESSTGGFNVEQYRSNFSPSGEIYYTGPPGSGAFRMRLPCDHMKYKPTGDSGTWFVSDYCSGYGYYAVGASVNGRVKTHQNNRAPAAGCVE